MYGNIIQTSVKLMYKNKYSLYIKYAFIVTSIINNYNITRLRIEEAQG